MKDSIICQGCSLIGQWHLQDFNLYGLCPGSRKRPGCLIKRSCCCWPLCVGSLILLSVNCHSKYLLSCPHLWFLHVCLELWTEGKRWTILLRFHPFTTHLITWSGLCLMLIALSGSRAANRETHGVAQLYLWLIGTTQNWVSLIFWSFYGNKIHLCAFYLILQYGVHFVCSHGWSLVSILHAEQVDQDRNCPPSVLTWPFCAFLRERPRCWAHVSWPNSSKQNIVMSIRPFSGDRVAV